MFILNKYTKWYFNIVNNAKQRSKPVAYTESHHIIPRSLGGSDDQSNRVLLTGREHALCHWLLTKMVIGSDRGKMFYALKALADMKGKYNAGRMSRIPSRVIAEARAQAAAHSSIIQTGRKRSQESIEKQRKAMTGRKRDPSFGIAISVAKKGKPQPGTPEEVSARARANGAKRSITDLTRKGSESHNSAKGYVVISPDGNEQHIRNLSSFCEHNGLVEACMRQALRHYPKSKHRGWKVRKA